MSVKPRMIDRDELATLFGLERSGETKDYAHDLWGLAALIRREIDRFGVRTTREVTSALLPIQTAVGEDAVQARKQVKETLETLAELGEVERGTVDRQLAWLRPIPTWIPIGSNCAVLLGTIAPEGLEFFAVDRAEQFVRWFCPDDDAIETLDSLGVMEQSFDDWLSVPDWRSVGDGAHQRSESLVEVWRHSVDRLRQDGLPGGCGDPTTLRLVRPEPGAFFGRRNAEVPEGRWTSAKNLGDGAFLGVQRGYSDEHWRPLLTEIENGAPVRTLFVPDEDQWRWLLLARSIAIGLEERVETDPESRTLQFTFPVPIQVRRILRLAFTPCGRWKWRPAIGVDPQLWRFWSNSRFG